MARSAEPTRRRILAAAYVLFRQRGYSRVSMDEIASATRVTKRTLYNHFQSKDQLLAFVLEAQNELALAAFATFGDKLSGSPAAIIDGLFRDLAVWADRPRWAGSGLPGWSSSWPISLAIPHAQLRVGTRPCSKPISARC
ncbi:TetR/AcrR family transcriptional regulator [Bradyrhizobium brasilense]|uniref:TetR/AcrR family transcriptional regulator n=1 Tax=Bradyrhizobium brasilense TaxID=1419277 RepID=UPI0014566CF4|nr:TetR/AcrR family transcriptional regulator [Bradyrhizobium brasilense]NLS74111.1 TetR/AcrR family transcriptional regulator [Bradyrhizobium brasilense]